MAEVTVGVISLAIQLCQGLVSFVDGVKNAQSKTEQTAWQLDRLVDILETLETTISKLDPTQVVDSTRTSITACVEAIRSIRKKLGVDSLVTGSKLRIGLNKLKKQLAFPFKESDIKYWKDVLGSIEQSLQTVVLALVIDQQRIDYENIRMQIYQASLSNQAGHQSVLHEQRDLYGSTTSQLTAQSHLIRAGFLSTENQLHSIEHNIRTALYPVTANVSHLNILPELKSDIAQLANQLAILTPSTCSASALETNVADFGTIRRGYKRAIRNSKANRTAFTQCTCRTKTETTPYLRWPFTLSRARTSRHDKNCDFSFCDDDITELTLQFSMCSIALGRKAHVTFAMSRGAGTFSINPALICHRIVDKKAPAFDLTLEFIMSYAGMDLIPTMTWPEYMQKLLQLFQTKKASPHDRQEDGMTLVHYLVFSLHIIDVYNTVSEHISSHPGGLMQLIEYMPNDVLELDNDGWSCADFILTPSPSGTGKHRNGLLADLLRHGVNINVDKLMTYGLPGGSFRFEDFFVSLSNLDSAAEMVMMRSEKGLEAIIQENPHEDLIDAYYIGKLCGLATRIGWLRGCELLVQSGLDFSIHGTRRTLLKIAIDTDEVDLVRFWLDARNVCNEGQLSAVGSLEEAFAYASEYSNTLAILEPILSYLVEQRRTLQVLAESHQMADICDGMREGLLDVHAPCIVDALLERGIAVPLTLRPSTKSVWYENPSTSSCDMLYEAGFTEVTGFGCTCKAGLFYSPLINMIKECRYYHEDLPDKFQWFLSKGASLSEHWPNSATTALHFMGNRIGEKIRYHYLVTSCKDISPFVGQAIFDNCDCCCSTAGCSFMTAMWKEFQSSRIIHSCLDYIEGGIMRREFSLIISSVEDMRDSVERRREGIELLRNLLFALLGLRHTCCDLDQLRYASIYDNPIKQLTPRYQSRELQRIEKEDAHLSKLLETLVRKFDADFDTFEGTLQEFFDDLVLPEMEKVLNQLKNEDKESFADGRRELGVVMDEDSESDHVKEDKDEEADDEEEEEEETDDEDG